MPRRVSLPGADELFRTTGGMSLTPAPRSSEAPAGRSTEAAAEPEGEHASGEKAAQAAAPASAPVAPQRRPLANGAASGVPGGQPAPQHNGTPAPAADAAARRKPRGGGRSRPTGRERHEEKITVYVSAEELIDLEHARLVLRGEHGLAVDRGRIVREAVAVVLADLEQRGEASILVRRLRGR
ncbi:MULTISPECIES: hypothetical protein [Streptacidiphilus]|uniref:Cobyrinic acid a,c-diamide synthase n=2 Tax=Streptacidiphilus TaxID=228398 RepID=A0ABV6UIK7_9ACTN|nr:hypothetical protein [Streptacidiphilus jeojiense]